MAQQSLLPSRRHSCHAATPGVTNRLSLVTLSQHVGAVHYPHCSEFVGIDGRALQ